MFFVERELPFLVLAHELQEHRQLDGTRRGENQLGVVLERLAGCQVLNKIPHDPVEPFRLAKKAGFELRVQVRLEGRLGAPLSAGEAHHKYG